ncbi:hypothetical protein SADUNF_Sadunf18G0028100 [Salix dunnii]|uniref:Pentatricopeptide repeat-containing protein n=1 Tax=Salix dunnii TaxID=1413687 RepID=A0A835MIJ5_9ROSI|nr:hypothetical protein SADUNF_Sadunf18G0028100 [Salix dunnii]
MATRIGALKIRELENFFVPILQNCKNIVELKSIHAHVIKYSLSQSNFLVTKMIDVCDKCEDLGYASLLFNQVKEPNGYLYNAMIRAYTHNEGYTSAILFYKEMLRLKDPERENPIFPDRFTFPFVIKSCSGLVRYNLGKQVHAHLCKFGPRSNITMENALIDMYTKTHSNLDFAIIAMEHLEELEPDDTGNYVLLSNIYADLGKWDGVSRMRKLIKSSCNKSRQLVMKCKTCTVKLELPPPTQLNFKHGLAG